MIRFTKTVFLIAVLLGQVKADPLVQSPMSFTPGAMGTWNADWDGAADRTYFFQWSLDLVHWHYAPFMDFGTGIKSHGMVSSSDKYFIRLFMSEGNYVTTLQEAEDADYDYDGLSNLSEIQTYSTDPMNWDTDGDGMDDGWEITNGLDPNDDGSIDPANGALGDPDGDGLENLYEYWYWGNPHSQDTDGDGLSDFDELFIYGTSLYESDSDYDGLDDYAEVTTYGTDPWNWDTDGDYLSDGDELLIYGTNPLKMDTDGDWMDDDWEIDHGLDPTDAADGLLDADSDGLANQLEYVFMDQGYDPFVADNAATFPWAEDPDYDGLTTAQEFNTYLTNPRQPDTDDDGLDDGWEIQFGYDPLVNNETDANSANDPNADPDGDNLTNSQEATYGTNPNDPDTDGDGVNDDVEIAQGSNPLDPNDTQPPPNGTVAVNVTFGDSSGSSSEKYRVMLTPLEGDTTAHMDRHRTNRQYGATQTDTFRLPKGSKYKVELFWVASDPKYRGPPKPDYDYRLEFQSDVTVTDTAAIPDDPDGILGDHYESSTFFATGKSATLYVAHMTSETVATLPADRKRTKIGVTEEVQLSLHPASLPSPTWQLTGNKHLSSLNPTTGITSMLTAELEACKPVAEAIINGQTVKISFDAVEPDGVVMRQEPGTGIEHTQGIPSAGFTGNPYITPNDVSFASGKVRVREQTSTGTGTGYYAYQNGDVHPLGAWKVIVSGDNTNPNKVDTPDHIFSGNNGSTTPSIGAFDWVIPMQFRVDTWNEKQFTTITHHHECDANGTVAITKGAGPFPAQLNDPTYP